MGNQVEPRKTRETRETESVENTEILMTRYVDETWADQAQKRILT